MEEVIVAGGGDAALAELLEVGAVLMPAVAPPAAWERLIALRH